MSYALNLRVARIVLARRMYVGLTQDELAQRAKLSLSTVEEIENATQECGLATFVALAGALGMEPHDLMRDMMGEHHFGTIPGGAG